MHFGKFPRDPESVIWNIEEGKNPDVPLSILQKH